MSYRQVSYIVCDGCYRDRELPRAGTPDGWAKWDERDLCPSCNAAVSHFLFNKDRVTVITAKMGGGHPEERERWLESLTPADRERMEAS